ncbi:helix-turn-helix domain-containing protein [Thalassobacillus devorans]|uniref:helix-turn-helix domain-containing protein n=1 Tax=Thalassobacillus devorans TaxID=279813 RepID=UPI0004B34B81|nr:helix-turn-helix domain-containing protein [Thalassobacillus devorans]
MYQLLLVDRDTQELAGIEWLLSKYSFPVSNILRASQLAEMLDSLENERPDILFIELDMIPEGKWELAKDFIKRLSKQVIAVTVEPTFERAMQAIEINAIDLLVKPISPSRLKHTIQQSCRILNHGQDEKTGVTTPFIINYESLFIDDQLPFAYPVYLVRTEYSPDLYHLRSFIEQFDFYHHPFVFSTSDQVVLAFNQKIPEPFQQARRFLREWEQAGGGPLAIAVHEKGSLLSLHNIYRRLRKVMEATFFTGYKQVLTYNEANLWKDVDPFLTMDEQRFWVRSLDEGQTEEIKSWLYREFFNLQPPYPAPGLLRTRLTSILAQIRRFMIRKGLETEENEVKYKKIFDKILYSPVLYRIVQDIVLFINDLIHSLGAEKERRPGNIGEAALAYMEEHYMNPGLSLKDVAAHIGRSPAYFSHLLSKKYQHSFREMLIQIRIQKAKELIETTDNSIQEIAMEVGFNQPNYFSRVFKSATGKTPREYRNLKG